MFGRRKDEKQQSQPPPQAEPEYTIDMVRERLDEIGRSRFAVTDPKVKVLLTLIAQNGESYLRLSSGGDPTELKIMDFMDWLKSLLNVIHQYVAIQDKPQNYSNSEELLHDGYEGVWGLATQVLNTSTSNERHSLTDFKVDTKILQSLSAQNT